jgi:Uma2 family endonuclease
MTTSLPEADLATFYPSSDGEPLAESYDHLCAIIAILEVLKVYLGGQQATVLANQFLYYVQGSPKQRVAPDVMVIFNVEPGGRDNYKIWEEGEVPSVVFEVTSPSTRSQDEQEKKTLYQELGISEYWQFDPRNEWIPRQLRGYRLQASGGYELIEDSCSRCLNLRLAVEGKLLIFYRLDNGDRLLPPGELAGALQGERASRQEAEQERAVEAQRASLEAQRADRAEQEKAVEAQRADRAEQEKAVEAQRADQAEQGKVVEAQRADQAEQEKVVEAQRADRAEQEKAVAEQQAAALRQKLRELGIDPDLEN